MKKLLAILLSITAAATSLSAYVYAADNNVIVVEGEEYTSATAGGLGYDTGLSNGQFYSVYTTTDDEIIATYEFEVPESGAYKLHAVTTKRDKGWTSDYIVWVNDADNTAKEYKEVSEVSTNSTQTKDAMSKFYLGLFSLKKGVNTICLKVDPNDKANGRYVFYLDCFELEGSSGGEVSLLEATFSDRAVGVFEEDEKVGLTLKYTANLTQPIEYKLIINDVWDRTVVERPLIAGNGQNPTFSLGKFKPGWYRIHLRKKGSSVDVNQYLAFTVTVDYSKRTNTYDGALATDVAAEYDLGSMAIAEDLANALRLQGFKWIRTRGNNFEPRTKEVVRMMTAQKNAGLKTTNISEDERKEMPNIKNINLQDVYDKWKGTLALNPVTNDMYEVSNETDLLKNPPALPDTYTAYYKTVAIALRDSGFDPYVSMSGGAFVGDMIFFDLQLQNGILDYSNIYNFHGYSGIVGKAEYSRKVSNAYSPEGSIRPTWMTENGLKVYSAEDGVVPIEQLREQSRYAVKGACDILQKGTDKRFFFLSRPFLEAGGGYGTFHAWTYQPYPVTAALSNMNYRLGDAIYRGDVKNLPGGVSGYVFDDGVGNDTVIFYSDEQNYVTIKADKVTYSDLYGYEEEKTADAGGEIKILVSEDPIYVKFNGRWSEDNYYKSPYEPLQMTKLDFDKPHRVVINAVWDDQDLSQSALMQKGYILEQEDEQHVSVRLYNFNDETVSGKLNITTEYDGVFDITAENTEFTIEPRGFVTLPVTLKSKNNPTPGSNGDIKFGAVLDGGEEVPAAVCRYWFRLVNHVIHDEDIKVFKDFTNPNNWDLTNIQSPGTITTDTDAENGTLTMHIDHGGKRAQWYFPKYKVQNPEIMADSDGIVVKRQNADNSVDDNKNTVFIYMKDGREYFSGDSTGIPFSTEWTTCAYPWDVFFLYSSPVGLNDIREFDPKDIEYVSFGVSGTSTTPVPDTTMKDFGVYKDTSGIQTAHAGKIEFSGIEDHTKYSKENIPNLMITLPSDELTDIRVIDYAAPYSEWTRNGKNVEVDLSKMSKGKHILFVSAKNKVNYRYTKFITFYIE